MRIWELAKELKVDSKKVLRVAVDLRLPIKNSVLVNLDNDQEQAVRRAFSKRKADSPPQQKPQKKRIEAEKRDKKERISQLKEGRELKEERERKKAEKAEKKKERPKIADSQQKTAATQSEKREKSRKKEREGRTRERETGKGRQPSGGKVKTRTAAPAREALDPKRERRKRERDRSAPPTKPHKGKMRYPRRGGAGRYRERRRPEEIRKKVERPKVVRERPIEVTVPISIKDFSQAIGVRANQIIAKLFTSYNLRVTVNQPLNEEYVEAIALEFEKDIVINPEKDAEETLLKGLKQEDTPESLQKRAPVVTLLGHVDHGKTSLLDSIRKTNVTEKEAGGITQHIGAYKVKYQGNPLVFLDTPGHEAFTSMRARGANVTDIVVLVVAADDGVMPQTVEAINHAKAADVPIVVAINKIDKPNAKPDVAMQQLSRHGLIPEKWQGETIFVEVSALTGQGIDELLEYLILVSEMLELKANPKRPALGTVLEAKVAEGKGTVATLLVQNGTLRRGDFILCGPGYGRIRALSDHRGKRLKEAGPSTPVEIFGLSELPEAGDKFYVVGDLSKAKEVASARKHAHKEESLARGSRKLSIEEIMKQIQQGQMKELRIVLKTDVHGSAEAIAAKLGELSHEEVKVKILHAAVGGITETDVQLAFASEAIILGFNVIPNKPARDLAKDRGVEIRRYSVIYHLLEDVKKIMSGMLTPETKEKITGHVAVRKVIRISKLGNIAGCYVTDGEITRNSQVRIFRQGVMLNNGKPLNLASLRRFKEDVPKVKEGFECGIRFDGFDDIKEGDELEAFRIIEVARTLD